MRVCCEQGMQKRTLRETNRKMKMICVREKSVMCVLSIGEAEEDTPRDQEEDEDDFAEFQSAREKERGRASPVRKSGRESEKLKTSRRSPVAEEEEEEGDGDYGEFESASSLEHTKKQSNSQRTAMPKALPKGTQE